MDKNLKITLSLSAFLLVALLIFSSYIGKEIQKYSGINQTLKPTGDKSEELKTFSSASEFIKRLNEIEAKNQEGMQKSLDSGGFSAPMGTGMGAPSSIQMSNPMNSSRQESSTDYSQTNVQVEGIDEADIVKTDGEFIYTAAKNFITISKAFPAEEAGLLSIVELKKSQPQEIFIDSDRLVVIGSRHYDFPRPLYDQKMSSAKPELYPYRDSVSFIDIYDIADRAVPKIIKKLEFDGNYVTSRKINDYVYFVVNNYPSYYTVKQNNDLSDEEKCKILVPQYREGPDISSDTEMQPVKNCTGIHYFEPLRDMRYATVIGFSLKDSDRPLSKEVILGGGENIYSSLDNIYIARTDYRYVTNRQSFGIIPGETEEKTFINRFRIGNGRIDFEASGQVPGRILNQFSMDEFDNHFRIATTEGRVSRSNENKSSNNIFILDRNLETVGSIRDIAPGEQIYSARFIGKRGYLVTFKKIDPFFTLDLSDPRNPALIGKLKIPGYSDYLHPYDENHIIGIGKNTVESSESLSGTADFAWYQGIKMALFDITDISNPHEMWKTEIGDRGTDSPILHDHKALLFSKEKNILSIPVLEAKLTEEQRQQDKEGNAYGDFIFQGAFVFNVSLDKGFELKGKLTHFEDDLAFKKSGYYFQDQDQSVKRSLYIGNNIYTISDSKIMINALENLSLIKDVNFNLPKSPDDNGFVVY